MADSDYNPWVTMSICSLGPSTLSDAKNAPKQYAIKNTNDVSDISGAAPKIRPVWNKPPMLQSEIPGSTSKKLSHERNTRDNSLYIDDIEGTRHAVKDRMMRTTRRVDPLQPNYPMASFAPDTIPETRFIKDPQYHDDIDGSHVKPKKVFEMRDTMNVSDVHGAQSGWRKKIDKTGVYDSLDTSDVQPKTHMHHRTSRRTDLCNPVYYINGMEYRDDRKSKPPAEKQQIMDSHLLQTKDITGATPGALSAFPRREYRNTNYIDDIDGAQADTTKHSMRTNRQSNPLNPVYQSLDPEEYLVPVVTPLLPPDMIKVPTIPRVSNKVPVDPHNGNTKNGHGNENRRPSGSLQLDFSKGLHDTVSSGYQPSGTGRSGGRQYGNDSPLGSNYVSPAQSARSQSNKAASSLLMSGANSKRAISERMDDINAVKALPM